VVFAFSLDKANVVLLLFITINGLLPNLALSGVSSVTIFKAGTVTFIVALVLAPTVVNIRIVLSCVFVIILAISASASSVGILAAYSFILFVDVCDKITTTITTAERANRGSDGEKKGKKTEEFHGFLLKLVVWCCVFEVVFDL
jgi:hypothetical protein